MSRLRAGVFPLPFELYAACAEILDWYNEANGGGEYFRFLLAGLGQRGWRIRTNGDVIGQEGIGT